MASKSFSSAFYVASQGLFQAAGLGFAVLAGRLFGPEAQGFYWSMQALLLIPAATIIAAIQPYFAVSGQSGAAVGQLSLREQAAVSLAICAIVLVLGLLLSLPLRTDPQYGDVLGICLVQVAALVFVPFETHLNSIGEAKRNALIRLSVFLVFLPVKLAACFVYHSFLGLISTIAVESLTIGIVPVIFANREALHRPVRWQDLGYRSRQIVPVSAGALMNSYQHRSAVPLTSYFQSTRSAGLIGLGIMGTFFTLSLFAQYMNVLQFTWQHLFETDRSEFRAHVRRLIAIVYVLTAVGAVTSAFTAPPVVALILGAQFEELGRLAPVFVLLAGLLALAEIIMRVAAVQGRTEIRVVYALVSWAAYLLALALLAGRSNGVLWAFVVSCAASTYLPALLLKPIRWAGILNFAPIKLAAIERPAS